MGGGGGGDLELQATATMDCCREKQQWMAAAVMICSCGAAATRRYNSVAAGELQRRDSEIAIAMECCRGLQHQRRYSGVATGGATVSTCGAEKKAELQLGSSRRDTVAAAMELQGTTLQLHSSKDWVTSPSAKVILWTHTRSHKVLNR